MKVRFPWPDPKLFPKAKKKHFWAVIAPIAKDAREDAYLDTMAALPIAARTAYEDTDHKIHLKVTFIEPDRRKRDDDGMIGAFKHARDGFADALGVDDSRFRCSYHFDGPQKPGAIIVEVLG